MKPIVLIHGGADDVPDDRAGPRVEGVKKAARAAYNAIINGGSAVDAVEAAINIMENDEYFNCGYGSVLNAAGNVEMDASIMDGNAMEAGAVTQVNNVRNPITLARYVLTNTPHTFLGAQGANQFAVQQKMPIVVPSSLVTDFARQELAGSKKLVGCSKICAGGGTVGAVALDSKGHLAAGTSTGGLSGKMAGRIGDSPIIGCGTYADDNFGAVSCTGHGESIIKLCLSHSIVNQLANGKTPADATKNMITTLTNKFSKTAGAICLSKNGDVGLFNTSERMPWAYIDTKLHYGTNHEQHLTENL